MPKIADNIALWDSRYGWPKDGDEWTDQAVACGVPYNEWKAQLVEYLILPHVCPASFVLEIAFGHGRWTEVLTALAGRYIGVDVGKGCAEFCQKRFGGLSKAEFFVNNGKTLPMVVSTSIDFVWSYDSFVHMEIDVVENYLSEMARVMKSGAVACIHHPGNPTPEQRKNGWRSEVTGQMFAELANKRGFSVAQIDSWGENNRCNTKMFGDCISILRVS